MTVILCLAYQSTWNPVGGIVILQCQSQGPLGEQEGVFIAFTESVLEVWNVLTKLAVINSICGEKQQETHQSTAKLTTFNKQPPKIKQGQHDAGTVNCEGR